MNYKYITIPLLLVFPTIFFNSDGGRELQNKSGYLIQQTEQVPCDSKLWSHVYHKERLKLIEECKTVTGVVVSKKMKRDGDYHIRLKLDKGQEICLNSKNRSKQKGCMVVEVICANEITREDAVPFCNGFVNNVSIPEIGQRVSVTGSYVTDTNEGNGWNEIHPVTEIKKIK